MESGFVITVTSIKPLLHKTQNTDLSKLVLYRTSSGQSVVVDGAADNKFPATHAQCEHVSELVLVLGSKALYNFVRTLYMFPIFT